MEAHRQTQRQISGRDRSRTAPARCAAYALLSEWVSSPHDLDPRERIGQHLDALDRLDYAVELPSVVTAFGALELDFLKRDYSGLFEVGSNGPPCPIREDLQTGQRAGTREDLVRFYSFFNYKLDEAFAWAPDHLSVELEFMHYLCYREATTENDQASYQLAQVDFSERHLVRWVPELAVGVQNTAPDSIYRQIIDATRDFLAADLDWQRSTVTTAAADQD